MLVIDEVGNVHDRIVTLVDYFCKGNATAFGRGADIQSGVLAGITSGRRNKPSFDVLQKILTGYPTVNPTWLLFGRGPMVLSEEPQGLIKRRAVSQNVTKPISTLDKVSTVLSAFQEMVEGFQKVQAEQERKRNLPNGHLSGFFLLDSDSTIDMPEHKLLTNELKITDEEARQLITDGKIKAEHIPLIGYHVSDIDALLFKLGARSKPSK